MQLSDYGMSRERGFLSPYEIDEVFMPTRFDAVIDTAERLTDLLSTGRVRHWLDKLPEPNIAEWVRDAPEEQVRTMMVHYSFLVQAWVWGEPEPPVHLPANLARPIVALAERRGRMPMRQLLDAEAQGILVEDGMAAYEHFTGKLAIEALSPSFLVFSRGFRKTPRQLALRRGVSLIAAAVGLVVTAPLLAVIALAIKLDSRGPVFFIHERAGYRGHPFRLVKFRTMRDRIGAGDDSVWHRDDEHRITRIGRWLRKLRLDELPQLVNIVKGDMDLVGPRPEIAENIKLMAELIPYYALRHVVRPGLTGWAQVRYGYSLSLEQVTEKMRHDLYYIKHMSFWLDLRILVDTAKIALFGRGAQ